MPALTIPQFDEAWQPLRPALVAYAARLVQDADAENLVSDTYVIAHSILDRFDADSGQAGLFRWLRSILYRLCLEHNRLALSRNELLLPPDALIRAADSDPAAAGLTQEEDEDEQDAPAKLHRLRLVVDAMQLPPRRRDIWNAWLDGKPQSEIAAQCEISQQAVSWHVGWVVTRLRRRRADLIGPADGYKSTWSMYKDHARATRYRRPQRRGSFAASQKLRRLN